MVPSFIRFVLFCSLILCIACHRDAPADPPAQLKPGTEISSKDTTDDGDDADSLSEEEDSSFAQEVLSKSDSAFIRAVTKSPSSEVHYKGKCINIAITGVDSRIGDRTPHADANHILSIYPDSGKIIITSIPRDTYADAGFTDSLDHFNILANVLANRSRKSYLLEAARIAEVNSIDLYAEVGFSQAMGVMELLGYKNPSTTLRVLRSRKGLGGDDFQRCYNQGQFIRQAILRHFGKLDGFFGDLLIRGGLLLVNSNLTTAKVKEIVADMQKAGFPKSPDDIVVRVRPPMTTKFNVYNFSDEQTFDTLNRKLDRFTKYLAKKDSSFHPKGDPDVEGRLTTLLQTTAADTAKHPRNVIQKLERPFEQHVWLQVKDPALRQDMRTRFGLFLSTAYRKLGKQQEAANVLNVVKTEEELFSKAKSEEK